MDQSSKNKELFDILVDEIQRHTLDDLQRRCRSTYIHVLAMASTCIVGFNWHTLIKIQITPSKYRSLFMNILLP